MLSGGAHFATAQWLGALTRPSRLPAFVCAPAAPDDAKRSPARLSIDDVLTPLNFANGHITLMPAGASKMSIKRGELRLLSPQLQLQLKL